MILSAALFSGCGVHYGFTRTTLVRATPRAQNCSFEFFTTRPDRAYDELGVLEYDMDMACNARDLYLAVRSQVCRAGGEGVITEVNGAGCYMRGTVIVFRK
jgi:hypothetical protein